MDEITPQQAAAVLGKFGASERLKKVSPERRREISKIANDVRWAKLRKAKAKASKADGAAGVAAKRVSTPEVQPEGC